MIRQLESKDIQEVIDLFWVCFENNEWYNKNIPNFSKQYITDNFKEDILFCLNSGLSYCIRENNQIISLVLCFKYNELNEQMFNHIFGSYNSKLHNNIRDDTIYILSCCTDKNYQNKGYASILFDHLIENYNSDLVGDTTSQYILNIARKRNFEITELEENYWKIQLKR